jgi:hypothetical protein
MKRMTCGTLFFVAAMATGAVYGGQEDPGVAGVNVVVKQMPNRRDVTNGWGIFAFDPLPAGSYTLSFKARPANDSRSSTKDTVIVAKTYSIKIEGAKSSANPKSLTSDQLLAGVDVAVSVGPGAKLRGQILPGATRKMVWIPKQPGSNLPGHWAEEGSKEVPAHAAEVYSAEAASLSFRSH